MPFVAASGFLALVAWMRAPRSFVVRVESDGLHHSVLNQRLAFSDIRGLRLSQHAVIDDQSVRRSQYFLIGHDGGEWRLPKSATCDRLALYLFLLPKTRLLESPAVLPGRLRGALEEEQAQFSGQVLAASGRAVLRHEVPGIMPIWLVCLAATTGALASQALPNPEVYATTFGVIAGICGFFGLIFWVALSVRRASLRKLRSTCGIVISPRCLTLEQLSLKGVLKWSEITGLQVVNRNAAALFGVLIRIDGGQVLLQDLYTCPLTEIYRQIKDYWSFEQR